MHKYYWLLFIAIIYGCSPSPDNYRLGHVTIGQDKKRIEFIFPPNTLDSFKKIRKSENSFSLSLNSRYQFVEVTGIDSKSYYNSLHSLNKAKYFTSKKPFTS